MRSFLQEVAEDLYSRYGDDISSLSILFATRRARLFFVDALSEITSKPIWQPEWLSIDDLMTEITDLKVGDRLRLVTELYKIYSKYHDEPFDKFYFWGEMLLSDFDSIDKYRVDADELFRNVHDIKELEADVSYLTEAQLKIIAFWSSLADSEDSISDQKRRFLSIWRTLGTIYREYREHLFSLGLAYGGMVQRCAADMIGDGECHFARDRRYVVVGFNALTQCEKSLFRHLSTAYTTEFFWDYDRYYVEREEQEAGLFVRDNIKMFPMRGKVSSDNFSRSKRFVATAAVSNIAQCKHVTSLLEELSSKQGTLGKETAIVLTDENLLLPLLYALPPEIGRVNVTMGYPLKRTLVYSFVERLIELQGRRRKRGDGQSFYHVDVLGILSHPYIADFDVEIVRGLQSEIVENQRISIDAELLSRTDLLTTIFSPTNGWQELSDYILRSISAVASVPYETDDMRQRVEFLAVVAEQLTRLRNSIDACSVDLTVGVYTSLVRKYLQTVRIPYEGEPIEGIQVMGILETRNLDFRNVIILSMTDDNFPGNQLAQSSYIPYNLRSAYELPTPEHHEGVYAYYFYRLIQRAENVNMLYCSRADERSTGESSRYVYQLDYESGFEIEREEVGVDVNMAQSTEIVVEKDEGVMQALMKFCDGESMTTLSPTAFCRYVACPLKFYFYSVARLKRDDELSDDVDASMFGTILHRAVHDLYGSVMGVDSPASRLEALRGTARVEQAVVDAINEEYLKDKTASQEEYTGNLLLVKDIVIKYINDGLLRYDAANEGYTVIGLEKRVRCSVPIVSSGNTLSVRFSGSADRVDQLSDGVVRVIDYKTGSSNLEFDGLESLFVGKPKQRLSNIIQTLLYSMMLRDEMGREIEPALYYLRSMQGEDYSPLIVDKSRSTVRYTDYQSEFEGFVVGTLEEIFNPEIPFSQCEDVDACVYCDYRDICRR